MNERSKDAIKQINSHLEGIASTINEVFSEYVSEDKTEVVLESIRNADIFFLDSNIISDTPNRYFFNLYQEAKAIDKKYGFDFLTTSLDFMSHNIAVLRRHVSINGLEEIPSAEALYKQFKPTLEFINIEEKMFDRYVKVHGKEKMTEYLTMARGIQRKLVLSNLKGRWSTYVELVKYEMVKSIFEELEEKYNVKSIDDLMDFHSMLSAMQMDKKSLGISTQNALASYTKKCSKFNLDGIPLTKLKGLQKDVEKLLNNYLFKMMTNNPAVKDFKDNSKIENFTPRTICDVANMIMGIRRPSINGSATHLEGKYSAVMFKDTFLSQHQDVQNDAIYHEFIHVLEHLNPKNQQYVVKNYRNLNELSCELLSRKCLSKTNAPILEEHNNESSIHLGYSHYDTVCERLKETDFMNDLVLSRINNDIVPLERKYGKATLSSICSILDMPDGKTKEDKLNNVIDTINKKNKTIKRTA